MSAPADDTHEQVRRVLSRLDGTNVAAVSALTGLSVEELDALGGVAQ